MKKLVFLLILPIISLTNTFNIYAIKNIELNKKEANSSLNSSEFKLFSDFDTHYNNSAKTCYYYYDTKVYYADFTSNSDLMLIETHTVFVPGNVAYDNGDKTYDSVHHLKDGYVHITPKKIQQGNDTSSSFIVKAAWPQSSTSEISVTTSFGGQYNFGSGFSGGFNMGEGAYIEGNRSYGLSLSFQKSTTITTSDPQFSQQKSPSNRNEEQFRFEYYVEGTVSYHLTSYVLLEMKKDGVGFNKESLAYDVSVHLRTVSWHNTWWEGHDEIQDTLTHYCNLGYYPQNPEVIY